MYIMGRYTTEEKKENRRIKAREWANNNKDKIKDPNKGYTKDNYWFAKWVLSLEGGVLP